MPDNATAKETEEILEQYEKTEGLAEETEEKEEAKEPSAIFKFLSTVFYIFLLCALGKSINFNYRFLTRFLASQSFS